jgi:hypothetical protein
MLKLVAGNCEMIPNNDVKVLATIVRALTGFPDQKRGLVTFLFLGFLDQFVCGRPSGAIDCALGLIAEF